MGKGRDKKKKKKEEKGGAGAKSKQKEEVKSKRKQNKKSKDDAGEPEEDIDAILANFQKEVGNPIKSHFNNQSADSCKQQEALYTVTEESNAPPPSRRSNASLVPNPLNHNELLIFGGEFFDGQKFHMYNDFYRYNIEKNEWRRITSPNSPGPRSSHQLTALPSGRLFLYGGEFVSPNETSFFHYKDFWTLDLKTNAWEKLELRGRPPPRSGHRMAVWKHLLVLFGGFYDTAAETRYYEDLWVFDTLDYKWTKVEAPEPRPTARSGFQFFGTGDVINLYGGYCKKVVKGQKAQGMVHNDMWVLKMNTDLSAIRWERRKKPGGLAPTLRSGCTIVPYKGKGIMFGGVSDLQESDEKLESVCHNDAYQYLTDSNRWYPLTLKGANVKGKKKRRAQNKGGSDSEHSDSEDDEKAGPAEGIPCPRFNPMMSVARNFLYIFGGIYEDGSRETCLADFWSLNLDKLDQWNCILSDDVNAVTWLGEESDEDDDDDEEEEDDEDEEDEADDNGEENDDGEDGVEDDSTSHEGRQQEEEKLKKSKKESKPELERKVGEGAPLEAGIAQTPKQEEAPSPPTISAEGDPMPKESLRDFYARTSVFWQMTARNNESDLRAGKALRKDAFELAQERFNEMRPQLEVLEKEMEENEAELVKAKARSKEEGADRMMSRNRR